MKNLSILIGILLAITSCDPRVEMDFSQWEMEAEITDVFIYMLQQDNVDLPDDTSVDGTKKVTVSESYDVDSGAATVTMTLKEGTDRSKLSIYIYHTGNGIVPLENSPEPGVLADWSSNTYKYRVTTESDLSKDWTFIIE